MTLNTYLFITIRRDARQNPIVQIMQLKGREALKKKKKKTHTPNENKTATKNREKKIPVSHDLHQRETV